MKKYLVVYILFFYHVNGFANQVEILFGKNVSYPISYTKKIGHFCRKKPHCLAIKKLSMKLELEKIKKSWNGTNPSNLFCEYFEGHPQTLKDQAGNEIAICTFDDSSFLITWDYIKKSYATMKTPTPR